MPIAAGVSGLKRDVVLTHGFKRKDSVLGNITISYVVARAIDDVVKMDREVKTVLARPLVTSGPIIVRRTGIVRLPGRQRKTAAIQVVGKRSSIVSNSQYALS